MLKMWNEPLLVFALLSLLLLTATFIRSKVSFFQNFFVPNSIIAGFLGLLFSSLLFRFIPLSSEILKDFLYHLLGITFIALTLKRNRENRSKSIDSLRTGFLFAVGYGIQAFIGFALALFVFSKIKPDFNPLNGILVQLGFSNSPSVASNIALGWENALNNTPNLPSNFAETIGIHYSSDIGLTFGTIGFLIACFIGILLIKWGSKRGYTAFFNHQKEQENSDLKSIKKGIISNPKQQISAGKQTTLPEAIDTLSIHFAVVMVIYLATYFILKLIIYFMTLLPQSVSFLAGVIINFHFIFGALIAMIVNRLLYHTKKEYIINSGIMERISGLAVDYMVTAAISAISLTIVFQFIVPILVISIVAGVATFFLFMYLGSRSFTNYQFERIITIFGIATGTMATGMALLRVMDPEYRSPIATDIMYGSGIVFFLTMPIMLLINLPLKAIISNNSQLHLLALFLVFLYFIIIILVWRLTGLIRFKKPLNQLMFWEKN
ncbi:MAG: hypothetical protein MJB14_05885 [Spirochaetes bacterium]|nr:hypothetical protein [Spirochaetota bacterium]